MFNFSHSEILDVIRFVPLLIVMGYAAYLDYKTGEVPNKIWLYAIFGATLTVVQIFMFYNSVIALINVLVVAFSIIIGFLTFAIGGGGADSKAFMMLGLSFPLLPTWGLLWPMPLPFIAMMIACIIAFPYILVKRTKESLWKRKVRFLPFLYIGLIVCVIL